tara:strand:- start:179 stop:382 length:204 start_codon:yes stop_codon:yes gene_type:complete
MNILKKNKLYESIGNYTKFKLVEMLIEKHQDRFKDFSNIEKLADDICKILSICGMKYYNELNKEFKK